MPFLACRTVRTACFFQYKHTNNPLAGAGKRQAVPPVAAFPEYPGTPLQGLFNEFDAKEQLVNVHGEHEYRDPGPGDIRGPCPGLNAAANHGYLPRDGIATYATINSGLWEAYGLDQTATQFLQQTTTLFDGDPLSQKWSIGYASDKVSLLGPLAGALLGTPTGICACKTSHHPRRRHY